MMIINPNKVKNLKLKINKVYDNNTKKNIISELIDHICHLQSQIVEMDNRINALEKKLEEVKDDRK